MAEGDLPGINFSASLTRRLEETAELIINHTGRTRILSHYDPDGIAAAAIVCKTLIRLGKPFKVTLTKKLDDKKVKDAGETPADQLIIFTDMGATRVSQLDGFPQRIIVVDHHQPEAEGNNILHVNPHFFNIDGAREASAASFVFSLATTIDDGNWDMASIAIAGAIGDRQNLGGFQGYNEELVAAAVQRELVSVEIMPDLKGQTIFESFTEHPEPYFVEITGRKQKASRFMKWLGLDRDSEFKKLDDEQKRFLTSICAMRLLRQGATPEAIKNFVTERYWLYDWDMYADELTAHFNACSRQEDQATGLAMALGDATARQTAATHRLKHQEWIIENLRKLEADPPHKQKHIQYFHTTESSYAGVLAGLGTLYFFDDTKATFGISDNHGNLNVSARTPRRLVEAGVNLGTACSEAGKAVGGTGGGHDIAAGATVPSKREKKFLDELDRIIGEQLRPDGFAFP
jgi:single-stranded-DNA-specific exonuclease